MMNYQQPFEITVGSNANSLFAPSSTGGGYTSDRVSTAHTSETKLPTSDSEAQWSRPPVNPSAVSPEYSHGYGLYHDGEKNLQSTPNPLLNVHRTVTQHVAPNTPLSLASTPHVTHRLPVSHDPISVSTDPQLTPVSGFSVVSTDKITLDKPDTAPQSIYSGAVRPRTSPKTATNVSQAKMPVRSTGLEQSKTQPKKSSRLHHTTSTTPHNQSLTTENLLAEQTDPFYQWYQMMSQYYRQFYPGYQLPQPSGTTSGQAPCATVPSSIPLLAQTYSAPGARQQSVYPSSTPIAPGSGLDYMSYYYQYYYGANAVPFWPPHAYPVGDPTGRTTPKLFPTPHIKALLSSPGLLVQVLPNRPMDGELARVELVDLSDLAAQAVAEATKRLSDTGNASTNLTRLTELSLCRDAENLHDGFSSGASGVDSPGRLSSVQVVGGGDDEAEEARACTAIAMAWDRTDHLLYPGPLSRSETLKADVLAFLREKLAEIQDRLPIDWESAGLLIAYLESMVKNNGNIQPSDLVNLLLEGHEPQTSDLRGRCTNHSGGSGSHIGLSLSQNQLTRNRSYLNDSLASLSPSQPPSGRQSPQTPYGMVRQSSSRAASDAGGLSNTQALLRRAAAVVSTMAPGNHGADTEDQALDRFRELLMHGMTMKALEHACRTRLWGHAFVLAQRLGTPIFDKVMERFINRAVAITDPILTLYQLTAGEMPQAVTAAAYGRGSDNGEWRPHLAMILAAESAQPELMHSALDRLGDGLLSRHLVYAAHLCYLLMGPQYKQAKTSRGPVYCLPDKIWLLGIPVTGVGDTSSTPGPNAPATNTDSYSPLKVASEAIQLTEIYEYAMKLANRNYHLPQLLPLKLVYATRLIDAGLLDKANRYLTAIGTELLLEASNQDITANSDQFPVLYSLVTNCLRLAEPLRNYSELDGFDSHLISSAPRNSRFSGFADGPVVPSSGSNADWLDRLRDLHRTMDKHLIRSGYYGVASKPQAPASPAVPHTSIAPSQSQAYADPAHCQASGPLNHTQTPATSANFHTPLASYQPPPTPLRQEPLESSKCNPMPIGYTHSDQAETWRSSSIDFHQHSAMESSVTSGAVSAYLIPDQNRYPVQPLPSQLPEHARTSMIPLSRGTPNVDSFTHQLSYPTQVNAVHQTQSDPSKGIDISGTRQSTSVHETNSTPTFQHTGASLRSVEAQPSHFSPGFDRAHASPGSGPVPEDSSASSGLSQDTSMLFPSQSQSPDTSTRFHQPMPVSVDQPTPNMFFTPATVSPQDDAPGTGSGSTAFDYFAGLQHQSVDEIGHRSRTVSGGSQGSLVGPYSSTTHAPVQAGPSGTDRTDTQCSKTVPEFEISRITAQACSHETLSVPTRSPTVDAVDATQANPDYRNVLSLTSISTMDSGDDPEALPVEIVLVEEEVSLKRNSSLETAVDRDVTKAVASRKRIARFGDTGSPTTRTYSTKHVTCASDYRSSSPVGRCLSQSFKPPVPGPRSAPLPPLPPPVLSIGSVPCDRCECWHSLLTNENERRVVQAPTAPRSRPTGGHCPPRRNSGTPERPYLPQSQQPLQASTRSINHPNEMQQPINEEPSYNDEQPRDSGQESNQSKEGWFSGWFGKRKKNGAKSVHLPDDSKPSIVWDDQLKQWIDINNPEAHEPTPPPPPAISATTNVSANLPKIDGAPPPQNRVAGRTSNRSRYVNVFANQTYGSAASKADAPLQPPLPPTMFAARSSDVLQDRLLNEHNMRPHYNAHVNPSNSR